MKFAIILIDIAIFILFFGIGWLSHMGYQEIAYQRDMSGLHMYANITELEAKDYVKGFEHGMFWMRARINVDLEQILIERKEVLKNLRDRR